MSLSLKKMTKTAIPKILYSIMSCVRNNYFIQAIMDTLKQRVWKQRSRRGLSVKQRTKLLRATTRRDTMLQIPDEDLLIGTGEFGINL
jgi:hypothetical protein